MAWIKIFFLISLVLSITSCNLSGMTFKKVDSDEPYTLYEINSEYVQTSDFTTRYLLEMLDNGKQLGALNVTYLDNNHKIKFESKRIGSEGEHLLTFVRDANGQFIETNLDGKILLNNPGNIYISKYTSIGESSQLPKLVQLILKTGKLSAPTFSGSISFSLSQLKENETLDNLYYISREIVDALVLNRIYHGDTIRDYCAVDETIYLYMVQETKQEYIIWFDGTSLTLAGDDISFLEEVNT